MLIHVSYVSLCCLNFNPTCLTEYLWLLFSKPNIQTTDKVSSIQGFLVFMVLNALLSRPYCPLSRKGLLPQYKLVHPMKTLSSFPCVSKPTLSILPQPKGVEIIVGLCDLENVFILKYNKCNKSPNPTVVCLAKTIDWLKEIWLNQLRTNNRRQFMALCFGDQKHFQVPLMFQSRALPPIPCDKQSLYYNFTHWLQTVSLYAKYPCKYFCIV